jgi:hypothetical protein
MDLRGLFRGPTGSGRLRGTGRLLRFFGFFQFGRFEEVFRFEEFFRFQKAGRGRLRKVQSRRRGFR